MIFYLIILVLLLTYIVLILYAKKGWLSLVEENHNISKEDLPMVSVVVIFKNEKDNLPQLLNSLANQQYPYDLFEIIAVNDHSDDNYDYSQLNSENVRVINSVNSGKKASIKEGIHLAKGEIILTTDADCKIEHGWIKSMVNTLLSSDSNMVLGSVLLTNSKQSFFQKFQLADFSALQIVGAGMTANKNPIFCNAANMGFYKKDWSEAIKIIKGEEFLSGDDVFLLHAFKKLDKKIVFNKSKDSKIYTYPKKDLKSFINQRIRWGGKTVGYNDATTMFVAILVFMTNLFLALQLILGVLDTYFTLTFIGTLIIKSTVDFLLLRSGKEFYNIKINFFQFLIFSTIYPFYIIYSAIMGPFRINKW